MTTRPDYSTAREKAGFGWSVAGSQSAIRAVTGIPIREFNLDPKACIEAYRRGRPLFREMFGDDVAMPGLATPAISYGHASVLGSELIFPEGGEVGHTHIYDSLEEGIRRLREPIDYANAGMAPFYLEFREEMRRAFPDEPVGFSFGDEGPITTAYELRGEGFFTDIFDAPDLAQEFLRVVTDSALDFHAWRCALDNHPAHNPHGAGMVDDLASFIPPRLFPDLVLPYWERRYSALTTGSRSAHVEDLKVEQLPFLEDIGLSNYDPSISPKLNPRLIARHCRVPFAWRLGCFHLWEMTTRDVEDFVFQSCADGASSVTLVVAEIMCTDEGVAQTHAFIRAAKEAKGLVEEGASREEIGERVSAEGRAKLWDGWCGMK